MNKEILEYQRDTVKLVVEEIDNDLVMSYADLDPESIYYLTQYLVGRLADMTEQEYNDVLNDLKEIE